MQDAEREVIPGAVKESAVFAYGVLMEHDPTRSARFYVGEMLYGALRDAGVAQDAFGGEEGLVEGEVEALRRSLAGWSLTEDDLAALDALLDRLGGLPEQRPSDRDPDLADPGAKALGPFARESETSRKAALAAYPRQGTQRWRIIEELAHHARTLAPGSVRGLTRDELARRTALSPNAVRPRVRELIDGGWVEEAEHFTRKSDAGHDASLVMLTSKAQQELAGRVREASPAEPR